MGLFGALLFVFYVVVFVVVFATLVSADNVDESMFAPDVDGTGFTVGTVILTAVAGIFGYLGSALLIRGSLLELDGVRPGFSAFWALPNVAQLVVFGVAVSLVSAVVNAFNPFVSVGVSLVLGVAIWFAVQFILDRGMSAVGSVAANIRLIGSNPGPLAVLYLALAGINVAGALLCGLGLIVTVPVSVIATSYAYRVLTGGTVSPPT
ncbi:hypothetical protein D8W71_16365 [Rhodococcus sp. P1Y]|nr:hypothetical protein D8W71_16365 [Rhodococcus sp. P1Y]